MVAGNIEGRSMGALGRMGVVAGAHAVLIFLVAARELGLPPAACFVVEDAPVGILAARRAGMAAVGVARHRDSARLIAAGANLVVTRLDQVSIPALLAGRLEGLLAPAVAA